MSRERAELSKKNPYHIPRCVWNQFAFDLDEGARPVVCTGSYKWTEWNSIYCEAECWNQGIW